MTNEITDYIKVERPNINYKAVITLTEKISVLAGDSATGKSFIAMSWLTERPTVSSNKEVQVLPSVDMLPYIKYCNENDIVIIDTELTGRLPNSICKDIHNSKSRFVLITRDVPADLTSCSTLYTMVRCADGCYRNVQL